jgi:hypothetical protein
MNSGIFLTVKDLMQLNGGNNYFSCAKQHRALRDTIATGKRKLTVKEYCDYEKIDFNYVWSVLRG